MAANGRDCTSFEILLTNSVVVVVVVEVLIIQRGKMFYWNNDQNATVSFPSVPYFRLTYFSFQHLLILFTIVLEQRHASYETVFYYFCVYKCVWFFSGYSQLSKQHVMKCSHNFISIKTLRLWSFLTPWVLILPGYNSEMSVCIWLKYFTSYKELFVHDLSIVITDKYDTHKNTSHFHGWFFINTCAWKKERNH